MIPTQRDAAQARAGGRPRDVAAPLTAAPTTAAYADSSLLTAGMADRRGVPGTTLLTGGAPEPEDDVEPVTIWALAARDGDPLAQAAFVRATHAEVWRFTAALVDPTTADDLTQETYLRAFRALPDFEGRASARTWLLGIARRACADHVRTLVRRRRLDQRLVAGWCPNPTEPDVSNQLGTADLLRRLPGERRAAFALTQILGLSYAEAAQVEGVPVGTIRSRVARARADLVEALGEALAS